MAFCYVGSLHAMEAFGSVWAPPTEVELVALWLDLSAAYEPGDAVHREDFTYALGSLEVTVTAHRRTLPNVVESSSGSRETQGVALNIPPADPREEAARGRGPAGHRHLCPQLLWASTRCKGESAFRRQERPSPC